MTYEIDQDVQIPDRVRTDRVRTGQPSKYPFSEMEIGDSFVFHSEALAKVRAASHAHGRRHGVKFTTSKHEQRCWRTE